MLESILQTLMGAIGSLGFAIVFNVRGQRLFFAFLGGVQFTYVVSKTICIYTCPVSSGMRLRSPPEVV